MELEIASLWDGRPARRDERVRVTAAVEGGDLVIGIDAPHHGDPPPPAAPGRREGLWEYEVVELFLAERSGRYLELEFGPAGHWLALAFAAPRRRERDDIAVAYAARTAAGRWRGRARVAAADLPATPWTLNAYAVHGVGAARRYLAWAPVPGAEPDFHRPDRFRAFPG